MGSQGTREARQRAANIADRWTRRAVLDMVRDSGGEITDRPVFRGAITTMPDAEPMAALRVVRHVKYAAQSAACHYIRQARENGRTWHEMGALADHAAAGHEPVAARR